MRFKKEENFSNITLSDSYNKNYDLLFKNKQKDDSGVFLFDSVPVFKYRKVLLKYDFSPTIDDIKTEVSSWITKLNSEDKYKVFSIKSDISEEKNGNQYVFTVTLINFDLN